MLTVAMATPSAWADGPERGPLFEPVSQERLNNAASNATDFLHTHGNYQQTRYHLANQINRDNVKNLKLAWTFSTDVKENLQAPPIVFDGLMLVTTSYNHLFAIDVRTGKQVWKFVPALSPTIQLCCGPMNRGVEVLDGLVYMATLDAKIVALDLRTGKLVWETQIADPLQGYSATTAPTVVDGMVIAGVVGAEYGIRGMIRAFDAKTGKPRWTFYVTPENSVGVWAERDATGQIMGRDIAEEKATYAKLGDPYKHLGGSIWQNPAVDLKNRRIYFVTGNPSPDLDGSVRPGDNLYTVSMVSIDLDTGKYVCHLQYIPHDLWDLDATSPVILTEVKDKDGKTIPGALHAGKSGYLYVHDARDCSLIRYTEVSEHLNMWAKPSVEGVLRKPANSGGVSTSPMAIDPNLHLAYALTAERTVRYFKGRSLEYRSGQQWAGGVMRGAPEQPSWGEIVAVNYDTGAVKWRVKKGTLMIGGALVTAGGVLFASGTGDGEFGAYNTETGEQLWSYKASAGVNAFPSTFVVDGKQYVAVGAGGNSLLNYPRGNTFLVFALDDSAKN